MINKYAEITDRILLYNACKGILRVKTAFSFLGSMAGQFGGTMAGRKAGNTIANKFGIEGSNAKLITNTAGLIGGKVGKITGGTLGITGMASMGMKGMKAYNNAKGIMNSLKGGSSVGADTAASTANA